MQKMVFLDHFLDFPKMALRYLEQYKQLSSRIEVKRGVEERSEQG